jgi:hypothetical protein
MLTIDPELERIARGDIPARYTHVVGVSISPNGKYAVVLLTTNEGNAVELDQTVAERIGDEWQGLSSGTPSSVIYVGDHRAAILCNLDPLPPDVERVIVCDRGEEKEVPVESGYFLYAAWKQDTPGDDTTDPLAPELVRTVPADQPRTE